MPPLDAPVPASASSPTARRARGPRRPASAATCPTASFDRVALPYRRELLTAALRLTRTRADAEDLVQDTLVRAYAAWPRFAVGTNCRAWLHRILVNGFISTYRRRRSHQRFVHERGDDARRALYGARAEAEADPHATAEAAMLGDEVVDALADLGEDHRRVVMLADLQGLNYGDIADRLGVPVGTVMSRLFRARRILEARLAEYAASRGIARRASP